MNCADKFLKHSERSVRLPPRSHKIQNAEQLSSGNAQGRPPLQ